MKKLVFIITVLLMASCQQDKIGYVNNVKLLDGYQEKIEVEAKFNEKRDALTKKSDSISQAFQIEYQALQAKRLSQAKAQEELGLLQQKSQFIGQQLQQEQQQLQQSGQTELDSVVSKMKREITAYGKTNGFTYILTGGEGGSVLYGEETKDLTSEILKILNDNYKK
ncbi:MULTISPECIES: OmpH family outer membrane protein [Croceitalea]|uniref:OmpH family outer membrane protein n=1 Tax=Croceitalea vernalis TaxID=3075599 RepID=A0ABU3BE96_9FLAO|nr:MULTISPECIES: OmpH family outer membrane protein [unclassified Croceitalea]MDT0538697.1 OmpH family outer membrane protein [Croceitalea sp. P059]MDT0620481.1 OmpH family outer membrane protein [Croceitalea sp. P007]